MPELTYEELSGGFALSNIEMVVLRTSTTGYIIKTADEATIKPRISSGKDQELRKDNTILAQYNTQDIVMGYDLELQEVLMHAKELALVDGGVATFAQTGGAFESYSAPVLGSPVTRTEVAVDIYCANRSTSGAITDYLKMTLENCEGKPCEFTIKDGEFYSPKYTLKSTPSVGSGPMSITKVAAADLPAVAAASGE